MPQIQLPIFPDGVEHINAQLAFEKRDGQVTYFNGSMPVFIHAENDRATFWHLSFLSLHFLEGQVTSY